MEAVKWIYTEQDAEADADLFMNEAVDFSSFAILDGDECVLRSGSTDCVNDDLVNFKIDNHLKVLRSIGIAESVLSTEHCCLETDRWEIVESVRDESKGKWPLKVRLQSQPDIETSSWAAEYDYDSSNGRLRQLRKDIERDQLLINSQLCIGASITLEGTLLLVGRICDRILSENHFPLLSGVVKNHFAHCVLMKASRTNAGGIAFSVLQNMIDTRSMILLPQSNIAPPIKVNIRLGRFPASLASYEGDMLPSTTSWGLLCQIVCDSYYTVRRTDDLMEEAGNSGSSDSSNAGSSVTGQENDHAIDGDMAGRTIRATYEDYVLFELKFYGAEVGNLNRVVDDSRILGQVVVSPND